MTCKNRQKLDSHFVGKELQTFSVLATFSFFLLLYPNSITKTKGKMIGWNRSLRRPQTALNSLGGREDDCAFFAKCQNQELTQIALHVWEFFFFGTKQRQTGLTNVFETRRGRVHIFSNKPGLTNIVQQTETWGINRQFCEEII